MRYITHIGKLASLPLLGRLVEALRGCRGLWALCLLFASCIDEDLSNCPGPCGDLTIRYVIQQTDSIDLAFDVGIRSLHAGFWASDGTLYEEYILGEDELPADMLFEITLPADDYSHIVTANCERNDGQHRLFDDDIQAVSFEQPYAGTDTIEAMSRAAYLGTLDIDLNNTERTLYEVPLRPMVAKLELTVNYAQTLSNIRCYIGNTKAGWMCWAGTAIDNERLVTDATRLASDVADSTKLYAFYAFPTVAEAFEPAAELTAAQPRASEEEAGVWKLYFLSDYQDQDEQKTVQHVFTINEPLRVGEVFRGTFTIDEDGGQYHDVEAGIEVDPDWNPGGSSDVEM